MNFPSPKRAGTALVLLVLLPAFAIVKGQTTVQVMVDQPEKLEVVVADGLFTLTNNSIIFGQGINLTGGSGPFSYTWYRDNQILGTNLSIEVPMPIARGEYSLLVTDANNCSVRLLATSNNEEQENPGSISVYPNPASRSVTIAPEGNPEPHKASFFNSNGVLIMTKQISGPTQIDLDLPSGIYYIKVTNSSGKIAGWRKFIVL
jgi:hypothetical protein